MHGQNHIKFYLHWCSTNDTGKSLQFKRTAVIGTVPRAMYNLRGMYSIFELISTIDVRTTPWSSVYFVPVWMTGSPTGTSFVSYVSLRHNGCVSSLRKQLTLLVYFLRGRVAPMSGGNAMAQMVEALRYKPEGRGFDSRRGHFGLAVESAGA